MPLGKPPPAQEPSPYLPTQLPPLVCNTFAGVRTDTGRTGVPDENTYWMDGVMPYAPKRARSMYGIGSLLFTASGALTIVFYRFVTLHGQPLCIVVMSDGSILQVRTDTAAVTTIAAAGTILVPNQLTCDINQWGNLFVLIVATQTNGYWVWDGSSLYDAGSIGPVVTIVSAGSGYVSQPAIGLVGGSGHGAVLSASISNGQVVSIQVINPGTGYLSTDTPTVVFSGGTTSGSGATITAGLGHMAGGSGASIHVTMVPDSGEPGFFFAYASLSAGGSSYSNNPLVNLVGGSPNNVLPITASVTAGAITSIITNNAGGPGWTGVYNSSVAPTAVITDAGFYFINSTTIVNGGSAYSNSPQLSVVDVTGSIIASPALLASVTQPGGSITSVSITSGGQFAASVTPTVVITDTSAAATATISLMPFAISGNTVETYQGYVWVGNGAIIFNSAPGSVSDFTGSNGGGNQTSNDSFLKVGYTKFIQMNGFLWLVSDCAVSYISGVQTVAVGSLGAVNTTYTKQNADPEVGSTWPNTVLPWGNGLMLSNLWGEFVGYGAEMKKVSEPMDGVYPSPTINLGITPSAAKAIVFNRKIVCLLIPITDPITGVNANKLLIWDGKRWWAAVQDVNLTYIQTQELNSLLTAWGTDGTHIYPLFQQPSTAFAKRIQTKLWDQPGGIMLQKAVNRFWGAFKYNTVVSPNLALTIDNEGGAGASPSAYTITGPGSVGYFVAPPQATGQTGIYTGLTIATSEGDIEFVELQLQDDAVGYRG